MIQTSEMVQASRASESCKRKWKPTWTTKAKMTENNIVKCEQNYNLRKNHYGRKKNRAIQKSVQKKKWLNSIELLLGVFCHSEKERKKQQEKCGCFITIIFLCHENVVKWGSAFKSTWTNHNGIHNCCKNWTFFSRPPQHTSLLNWS